MIHREADVQEELRSIFAKYGIDFSIVKNFRGAPVQGYVAPKSDGSYQMVVTIRNAYADIFWFSIFHELGHIVNGDINKKTNFVDDGSRYMKQASMNERKENMARLEKLIRNFDYPSDRITYLTGGEFEKNFEIVRDYIQSLK